MDCTSCGSSLPEDGICPQCPAAAGNNVNENSRTVVRSKHGVDQLWAETCAATVDPEATIKTGSAFKGGASRLLVKVRDMQQAGVGTEADYEMIDLLGTGGMGEVFVARQTAIDREVAVKMIKPGLGSDIRFLSEAAVTGELDHPNIVPIYDVGKGADGKIFYAMKYVKGRSWGDLIHEQPEQENLRILLLVADAVAFAHSRGILHRDLKPENVMLGDYGEVLVMDWGLAVSLTPSGKGEYIRNAQPAGTPAYMAPEMVTGDFTTIDARSDIYLLGAILYEIITGHPPHGGKTSMDCLYQASENSIIRTDKKGELIDIAMKAMAGDPANRHETVKDFQAAIRDEQTHRQSITLSTDALGDLEKAKKTNSYNLFAQALFGFQSAQKLWAANSAVKKGIQATRQAYARCAMQKEDYDLALSVLDRTDSEQAKLAKTIREEKEKRSKRKRRVYELWVGSLVLLASIGIVLIIYYYHFRSQEQEITGLHSTSTDTYADALAAYDREKANYEKQIKDHKRDSERHIHEIESHEAALTNFNRDRRALEKKIQELSKEKPRSNAHRDELQRRSEKLQTEAARLNQRQSDLNRRAERNNARSDELNRKLADINRRRAELQKRKVELDEWRKRLGK